MATTEMTMQQVASSVKRGFLQILRSRILDKPEYMQETCEQLTGLTRCITEIIWTTRDVMGYLPIVSLVVLFDTGKSAMVHYANDAGSELYVVPRSVGYNSGSQEIRPAFISDGFNQMIDERKEDLYLYICDSFSTYEQLELLHSIIQWYKANFMTPNGDGSRISKCVKDFCGEMERIISEARE